MNKILFFCTVALMLSPITLNAQQNIFEDFESHTAFTINSPGQTAWSYIDGDGQITWAISNVKFPNMESKMAYMIMEPKSMTPDMSESAEFASYSGDKYLASLFVQKGANEDYIISPELNFTKPFTFSFYAKGFIPDYNEQFKVGYSIKGKTAADFTSVTTGTISPSTRWKKYSYEIPAEAKYVCIEYVSTDGFMFMVDDIFIGDPTTVDIETETPVQQNLSVYPNPVRDILNLENVCSQVSVYDLAGRKIWSKDNEIQTIDMSNFENGAYVLKATQNGKIMTSKIIVNK